MPVIGGRHEQQLAVREEIDTHKAAVGGVDHGRGGEPVGKVPLRPRGRVVATPPHQTRPRVLILELSPPGKEPTSGGGGRTVPLACTGTREASHTGPQGYREVMLPF